MRGIIAFSLAFALCTGAALAFGTIEGSVPGGPRQSREHEWITRRAFACSGVDNPLPDGVCFHAEALNMMAGKAGTLGAIGWTDAVHFDDHRYHCDNGDYLNIPGYRRTQQEALDALRACRNLMIEYMDKAVTEARKLVSNGRPVFGAIPHSFCNFNGKPGDALCNTLEDFGAALHAVQDFYSHSNWVDVRESATPTTPTFTDPPAMGQTSPVNWLDLSRSIELPSGVITGCYSGGNQGRAGCDGRVTHYTLNKDLGTIPLTGPIGPARTDRGRIADNFARAVTAAVADSRRQWTYLRDRLTKTYGTKDGALMACILMNAVQSDVKSRCAY